MSVVDNEETKRRSRWQDAENEQKVLARKVKHRDDRSLSRSRSSSVKAEQKLDDLEAEVQASH